ncbi:hypothetical protein GGF31_007299 [Allomyces arbusculus]|nr:hypothetical protein GGF31_007299 [Allomyces arbusculus]
MDVLYVRLTDTVARLHEQYHDLVGWTGAADLIPRITPCTTLDPTTPPRAVIQAATDAVIHFLEHDLDLTTLASHLRRSAALPADVDLALREYRRFLILKVMHRDEHAILLSPSPVVDTVWHAHMLDTRAYLAMNDQLPFFVHHDPRGAYDEDAANRARRLDNTRACYRARWGDMPAAVLDDTVEQQPPTPPAPALHPAPVPPALSPVPSPSVSPTPSMPTSPAPLSGDSSTSVRAKDGVVALTIQELPGSATCVHARLSETVARVMARYSHDVGLSNVKWQTVVCNSKTLDKRHTLSQCGIANGAILGVIRQQPSRAAASRAHPYAKPQAYATPHDGAWWPLALYQYWLVAASPSLGTAPYGAWSCGVPLLPLPSWFSSYCTIPVPSQGHQQRANTHARPSTVVVDNSQAGRQAVPTPADRQVAVPAPPAEPTRAAHLNPPVDMDLALREYRRFLIRKVVHRGERATLLSPGPHIDQVWHAHVLDTQAYMAMNEQLPIYIHHNPNGAYDEDAASRARRLDNTRVCYRVRWGELPAAMWDNNVPARPACRGTRAPSPTPVQHRRRRPVQVVAAAFAARFGEDMSKLRLSDAGARLDLALTLAECGLHADDGPHTIDVAHEQVGNDVLVMDPNQQQQQQPSSSRDAARPTNPTAHHQAPALPQEPSRAATSRAHSYARPQDGALLPLPQGRHSHAAANPSPSSA